MSVELYDYICVASLVDRLLTDVCGELENLEGQNKPRMEAVA